METYVIRMGGKVVTVQADGRVRAIDAAGHAIYGQGARIAGPPIYGREGLLHSVTLPTGKRIVNVGYSIEPRG